MGNRPKRPKRAAPASPIVTRRSRPPIGKWAGWIVGGGLVAALTIFIATDGDTPIEAGVPEGTINAPVASGGHSEGDIDYGVAVPPGGLHNPVWLNCGVYAEPVRTENAVHSLEHAAVWISYRPDIAADEIAELESLGRDRAKTIVSPVPDQEPPIMATAWGWQLELERASDDRLLQFVNHFAGSFDAPEPRAAC